MRAAGLSVYSLALPSLNKVDIYNNNNNKLYLHDHNKVLQQFPPLFSQFHEKSGEREVTR